MDREWLFDEGFERTREEDPADPVGEGGGENVMDAKNGCCFICFKLNDSSGDCDEGDEQHNWRIYQMKEVLRYLNVQNNKYEYHMEREEGELELEVPLCVGCGSVVTRFSYLFECRELIDLEIKTCLKRIREGFDTSSKPGMCGKETALFILQQCVQFGSRDGDECRNERVPTNRLRKETLIDVRNELSYQCQLKLTTVNQAKTEMNKLPNSQWLSERLTYLLDMIKVGLTESTHTYMAVKSRELESWENDDDRDHSKSNSHSPLGIMIDDIDVKPSVGHTSSSNPVTPTPPPSCIAGTPTEQPRSSRSSPNIKGTADSVIPRATRPRHKVVTKPRTKLKAEPGAGTSSNKDKRSFYRPCRNLRLVCQHCGNVFKENYKLRRHIETVHLSKRDCVCEVCGKKFYSMYHVNRHKECVHSDKEKKVRERKKKTKHVNPDSKNDPRFVCDLCGKTFKSGTSATLRIHKEIFHFNTGQQYPCEICGKIFYQKFSMQRHQRMTHFGVKHNCPKSTCEKKYSCKKALKKHVLRFHPELSTRTSEVTKTPE